MSHRNTSGRIPDPTRVRAALSALAEGVTLADTTGRITYSNPAADQILGIGPSSAPPEEWAQHYGVFVPGTDRPFPTDRYPLVRALARERTDNVEMWIRNQGNPEGVLISVSGRPVLSENGELLGAAVVFRNVTALRTAQNGLERAMSALRDAQAQKNELIAFLVHDMKGPLTAILASAQLMTTDPGRSPEDLESLAGIMEGAESLHRMVLDLLDIQAGEDGRLDPAVERIAILPLLERVAARAKAHGRVVGLEVADDIEADADPELLQRIALNLVENCLKYSEAEIPIFVTAERTEAGGLLLAVRDEGPGVPQEFREAIFEKYARIERNAERRHLGSRGIGLRFCRVAAEAHGGRIWVEDNAPKGAAFFVELPGAG
jgi:signal transduction histidine kinase